MRDNFSARDPRLKFRTIFGRVLFTLKISAAFVIINRSGKGDLLLRAQWHHVLIFNTSTRCDFINLTKLYYAPRFQRNKEDFVSDRGAISSRVLSATGPPVLQEERASRRDVGSPTAPSALPGLFFWMAAC
jgi:hypothetical protein